MKTSSIKAVGRKAEQGIQISLFCPSEVAALYCPPHLPDRATDLWLPGTTGGAGSWSGMSLKGVCMVTSHKDKGGELCECVINADGFGSRGGWHGCRRDSVTGGTVSVPQEAQPVGVWHCPTPVRRVPAPLMGENMLSSKGVTFMVWIPRFMLPKPLVL